MIDTSFGRFIFSIRHLKNNIYTQQDLARMINHLFLALRQNYGTTHYVLDEEDKNSNWPTNATISFWEKKDLPPQMSYLKELAILGTCLQLKAITNKQQIQALVQAWGFRPLHQPEIALLASVVEFEVDLFLQETKVSPDTDYPQPEAPAHTPLPRLPKQAVIFRGGCLLLLMGLLLMGSVHLTDLFSQNKRHQITSQMINGVEMVLVPKGCFQMGYPEGRSDRYINIVHSQCFEHAFWIDKFEVTNAVYGSPSSDEGDCDYEREIPSGKVLDRRVGGDEPERPRNCVNWFEAVKHCQGRSARLPTEREWEYAARGPEGWIYPWGNVFEKDRANIRVQGMVYFAPAKDAYPEGVSWVGAYNLSGGLYEWVSSAFGAYPYVATDGREDLSNPSLDRVIRGGSWDWPLQVNDNLVQSSYYRSFAAPDTKSNGFGFRCVIDIDSE